MKKNTLTLAAVTAFSIIAITGCGGSSLEEDLKKANEGRYDYIVRAPYPAPQISEAQKAEFLNAVNAARAQQQDCGEYGVMQPAPPLQWSDILYHAAYEHSADMHDTGILQHSGSGTASDWTAAQSNLDRGSTPTERAVTNGANNGVSENAAEGYGSTEEIMRVWLNSPGHCRNLMDPTRKSVGMARVGKWWTQNLSRYTPEEL